MKKITLIVMAFFVTCCVWQMNAQTITGATGAIPDAQCPTNTPFAATSALSGNIGTAYEIDNLTLNITHTFDGDLEIRLESPSGTVLDLAIDQGAAGDDFVNTVFMDGNPSITTGSAPYTGTFEPQGGTFAAAFDGEDVNGDWILQVCDDAGGDTGTVDSWEMTFNSLLPQPIGVCGPAGLLIPAVGTSGPMDPSPANVTDTGVIGTDYTLASVELDLNHTFDGDLDITLTSPMGTILDLSSDNGGSGDNFTGTIFADGNPNITTGAAPFTGMFEPEGGTLNGTFAGESITGDWTLNITDDAGGDSGILNMYCINFEPILGDPPVISCPANIAASTDPGACGAIVNYAPAVAIDPDGDLDTVVQISPDPGVLGTGDEFPVGTTTVTFRATDLAGNFADCSFDIVVTDDEDPTITCSDLTVELDAAGMATVVPGDVSVADDNCPGVVVEFGGAGAPGSLTTTFANNNGQSGNMFDIVALNDITINSFDINMDTGVTDDVEVYFKTGPYLPSISTPADWTLVGTANVTSAGEGVPTPLNLNLGISVAAGDQVAFYVTLTTTTAINYTNGSTTGALFASDANLEFYEGAGMPYPFAGNFNPRVFNGNIVYETGGVPTPSLDFTCADVGVNTVTVTATDASGNTASCTTNITVEDNIAPVIVCIGESSTVTDSATSSPALPINDNVTQSDVLTVTADETISDLDLDLDINHTWTGDLQITLESPAGTQALIFDGGADGCSADDLIVLMDDESANPLDCDPSGTGSAGDAFPLGDYIPSNALSAFDGESTLGDWTLSIEDTAGGDQGVVNSWSLNYSFDVVATPLEVDLDAMGNASINASDLLLSVDEACGWTATVGGAGASASLETTFVGGNGNFGNMFDINAINDVTIDSFDIHGDTGATFDVEVYAKLGTYVGFETDAAAWTLLGTAPGVVSNGDDVATPLDLMLGYVMAAGETHAFYVTPTDFSTGGFNYTNGTTVGAVFASDANIEFLEGAGSGYPFDGTLFSPRVFNGNIIYTAGGGMSTTIDFTCEDLGANMIEVTVTDDSGNVSTCMATVNVNDVTDPILICMDVTIELGPDGTAVVDPAALLGQMPGTFDVITISSDNQSGTPGNTDFTVDITDAEDVTFDWMYNTDDGAAFDSFGYLLNGVFTELIDPAGTNAQSGSAGPITLAPGDVFGFRSSSVDGEFGPSTTVVSNFQPGFTGQFDPANWLLTLDNSDGDAFFVEIPGGPLSFDACGITVLAVDVTEVTCDDIGTPVTATVFASDASGNIASCTSIITVVDLLGPEITCPADQTVDPGAGQQFYVVPDYFGTGEATATDNCTDPVTITSQDPAVGALLPDGVYPVTLTAEDEFGNIGTCTFELTVESILGVEDTELGNAIAMYPNPAQNKVTISNTSSILLDQAVIYDANGRLISTIDLSDMQQEKTIDVSQLASGVYMVQIQGDNASTVKRLVKE